MKIHIDITKPNEIDSITMKKMAFFYNALQDGWSIKKIKGDKYVFTKNHEGKKEVFLDNYLKKFLENNFNINKIINQTKYDDK